MDTETSQPGPGSLAGSQELSVRTRTIALTRVLEPSTPVSTATPSPWASSTKGWTSLLLPLLVILLAAPASENHQRMKLGLVPLRLAFAALGHFRRFSARFAAVLLRLDPKLLRHVFRALRCDAYELPRRVRWPVQSFFERVSPKQWLQYLVQ